MTRKRFVPMLLLAFTLVIVPACGDDEPAKPDVGADKPAAADNNPAAGDADTSGTPAPDAPKPKLWTFDAESLTGYVAVFKDLKENAPEALKGAAGNAVTMAKKNDGLDLGDKGMAILEDHGITVDQFKKFGNRLWPAVVAVAPEKGTEALGGLTNLAGSHSDSIRGLADSALKDITKDVTEEDKVIVKENLDEILELLE